MRKQAKKKKQNIYQIFGLNGTLNILEYKKKKIIRVDIMQGGVAERKSVVNKLVKNIMDNMLKFLIIDKQHSALTAPCFLIINLGTFNTLILELFE